jgi:molecular chaperone GrpE (heat shock protein)
VSGGDDDWLLRDLRVQLERDARLRERAEEFRRLMCRLLDVMDAMKRAEEGCGPDTVRLLGRQLRAALTDARVQLLGAVGEPFDPQQHAAVEARRGPPGVVLEVVSHGCRHDGELVRPARVVVGEGDADE